jgi:hypothetical protein
MMPLPATDTSLLGLVERLQQSRVSVYWPLPPSWLSQVARTQA